MLILRWGRAEMGKDINSLIKDIFEEEFENIEYPPSDEMWGQIRLKFKNERDVLKYIGPFLYFLGIIMFAAMGFIRPAIGIFGAVAITAAFSLQFLGLFIFSTSLIGGLIVLGIIVAVVSARRAS